MASASGSGPSGDFVCVVDVEATRVADRDADSTFKQEIVELPCVMLDVRTSESHCRRVTVAAVFHTFVRPTENPRLNRDTTSFMPICQSHVDGAPTLSVALEGFTLFAETMARALAAAEPHSLDAAEEGSDRGDVATPGAICTLVKSSKVRERHHVVGEVDSTWSLVLDKEADGAVHDIVDATIAAIESATSDPADDRILLASDGPWDVGCYLSHEVHRKRLTSLWRPYMDRWWNIRWAVGAKFNGGSARGLNVQAQLRAVGLSFVGEEHSGIADTLNIAAVACALIRRGVKPRPNDGLLRRETTLVGRVFRPPWYRSAVAEAVAMRR